MKKYIICAILKNELDYLEEWIQYHLNLGFNSIRLFEDIDSVSHKQITDKYPQVTLQSISDIYKYSKIDTFGGDRQNKLYSSFLTLKWFNQNTWIAFIDIDEYITLAEGETLDSVTEAFKSNTGILMYWKMYNADNKILKVNAVQDNYNQTVDYFTEDDYLCYKSFVNLDKAQRFDNHHRIKNGVDENKKTLTDDKVFPSYNKIWIRHYYTKSVEDWIYKFKERHTLCQTHRAFDDFFDYNPELEKYKEEIYHIYMTSKDVYKDLTLFQNQINTDANDTGL